MPRIRIGQGALEKIGAALELDSGKTRNSFESCRAAAAEILTSACIDGDNVRATSIDRLADKLFGGKPARRRRCEA